MYLVGVLCVDVGQLIICVYLVIETVAFFKLTSADDRIKQAYERIEVNSLWK